jgi:hypothetical protein
VEPVPPLPRDDADDVGEAPLAAAAALLQEARQQLAVLREKWPIAFPVQHQDVRPLAMGVARQVAAAMGWSLPYTLGVLGRWKMAAVYCQAVLCHDQP